jgi:putative Mg2+ transporter-C (MgtC) family protein
MNDLDHLLPLLLAFALSSIIGLERELRQKSAGLRTHTLVGVGAAVFILVSKYGFEDVVSQGTVELDPSRVAAQVVSGIGFIGAGVIFLRRDGVRGLTTAAAVWLTAAVGLAAGAGLVWIAVGATVAHLLISYLYTPLVRRLPRSRRATSSLEVEYRDGEGVLRRVLSTATDLDYVIADLEVTRRESAPGSVSVAFDVEGRREIRELVEALEGTEGVLQVHGGDDLPL